MVKKYWPDAGIETWHHIHSLIQATNPVWGTCCISGMRLKMNKCPDPAKLPALERIPECLLRRKRSENTAHINTWWNCSFQCFDPEEEHKWVPYVNDTISFKTIILWRESLSPLHITFYIIIKCCVTTAGEQVGVAWLEHVGFPTSHGCSFGRRLFRGCDSTTQNCSVKRIN